MTGVQERALPNTKKNRPGRKHLLGVLLCDILTLLLVDQLILVMYPSSVTKLTSLTLIIQMLLGAVCIFGCRFAGGVYHQIWRFGGSTLYLRLILMDAIAGWMYFAMQNGLLQERITFIRALSIVALNLLATLFIRLGYQFLYEYSNQGTKLAILIRRALAYLVGLQKPAEESAPGGEAARRTRINVAIVGAGRIGVMLAEELANNPSSSYMPCCFIDIDREKVGRYINGIRVFSDVEATAERLRELSVHEIVFALPGKPIEHIRTLYDQYKQTGCRIKVYDYPIAQTLEQGKRRQMREFDIEDLLFRKPVQIADQATRAYYAGKRVLISGGGGSIGGELCRQIAQMGPARLVILDVYENGAYDIQQELKMVYGAELDLVVEIASVCDREALERIFERNRPDIVLHAAAHKHVPLMERNCCEAVKNNVFGTLNIVETAEKYGVEKFTMISTDKAVNPTNVMGATKRICEMIVQSRENGKTNFSATRFGNVLGSNGSVIPLFKRQIASGGPVTITDKRIIRYFMTIAEASQLVLQSGAMARNGELYVLDMGKPVRILELAENMIRLSGMEPYRDIDIVEIGLRPGEKLYEELLINTDELERTSNSLIFVERDQPEGELAVRKKLEILRKALETGDEVLMRAALKSVVSEYRDPENVNAGADASKEMKMADENAAG